MMNHQWKAKVRAYLASVSYVDMLVGRVLNTLESESLMENTVVVLFSDHGYHLGSKAISGKNTLWHESTRVPFIFAGPGISEQGKVSNEAVELLDLYPTLVELAGLPAKEGLDGQSLTPLLKDVRQTRSRPAITTHGPDNHAIVTEQWRFIQYADGSQELYNLQEDPYEWVNLASNEAYAPIIRALQEHIPESSAPAPGNTVRLIELKDGIPYWQGEAIPENTPVPMAF